MASVLAPIIVLADLSVVGCAKGGRHLLIASS